MRLAFALCALVGCGHPPPPPPPGAIELQLGTAESTGMGYEAMPATATLVPGAQGGFHVWLSYRVKNGDNATLKASHTVRRESDGKLLSRGERKLELGAAAEDGWWQSGTATPAFLCPTPLGVSVIDVDAVFEVTLTMEDGSEAAKQQVKTKLSCPTDDQAEFCARICQG